MTPESWVTLRWWLRVVALVAVLKARPDLTALLDVTWPEPPADDSELWQLPNVLISPHIGGTIGNEVTRLADCAIE